MTTTHFELEGREAPHVPAGQYLARLTGVERASTKFGDALRWRWAVVEPTTAQDVEVTQMTSTATSSGSNAGRLIRALVGRGLASGEKISTAALVGQAGMLVLSVAESGWNRVEDVLPAPQPAAPAPEPVGQAVELPF